MASIASETGVQFEWLATGRGSIYPNEKTEPNIEILGIAENAIESRMLGAMKRLTPAKQALALKMVSVLAGD